MAKITLSQVTQTLEEGWGNYIPRFHELSGEAQTAFLEKQGFESLHDLIAHIIGWWEEGLRVINGILEEPGFIWKGRDTDAFNRELVEKYRAWSQEDLLLHYENVRAAMLDLVSELPESALDNEEIHGWLAADVIEHLEDHKIG
ncbi:MAG: ClbS/DfsB family four-helix bundle protein [Chloroflexota bacterium]